MKKTFIGKEEISKEYCSCETNPNCYYKQLKRKEQECEKFKQALQEIKNFIYIEKAKVVVDMEDFWEQILQKCEVIDEQN